MGVCSQETSEKILDLYYNNGGNFIDTSSNYQHEQTEEWLGEWMKKRNNRDQIVLATKYTMAYRILHNKNEHTINSVGNGNKSLHLSFAASLKKLQTDYIDLLYVHWWDHFTSVEELMQSLNTLVRQGKVLYLGISDSPAWFVSKCNQYARDHGLRPFSVYQGKYNAAIRDMEREVIPMCQAEGMGIAPWGALGGGAFYPESQKKDGGRQMPRTTGQIKISAALEKIANAKKTKITSVAMAYTMSKSPYVFPIIGGRNPDHLQSNIEALELELSPEDIESIEAADDFDIGFPTNFIGGAKGVQTPDDIGLLKSGGVTVYVDSQQQLKK